MNSLFSNCFGHEVKVQLIRESKPTREYQIRKPNDAYDLVKGELMSLDREAFWVIALDRRNLVLGLNMVSIGTVSASLVHPREVFKSVILMNASSMFPPVRI